MQMETNCKVKEHPLKMAINYTPLDNGDAKWYELAQELTFEQLRDEVNRLYDETRDIIKDATDAQIAFVPHDPEANDPYAETEEEKHIGWTLGHLVAHVTATDEEAAVFTSLLARGIPQGGRIRTETPWEDIDTTEKALQRLEESRRIVLAYLDAIPDEPNLDTYREFSNERVQGILRQDQRPRRDAHRAVASQRAHRAVPGGQAASPGCHARRRIKALR